MKKKRITYYEQGYDVYNKNEPTEYVKVVNGKIVSIYFTKAKEWRKNNSHYQLYKKRKRITYEELVLEFL